MSRFLRRLELRTNRAYWSDGLLDLFSGLSVTIIGISWITHFAAFGGVVPALLIPLWGPVRRRFTEPRLGLVELAQARQNRNRAFMRLMVFAGVVSLLLGVGAFLALSRGLTPSVLVVKAIPGLVVGLAGIAAAEALQLPRFLIYGGLTVATALVVAVIPELNPGWAFVSGGVAALIGGTRLAIRLARRHPARAPSIEP